ncbi:MAG: hypothetical protein LIP02_01665, partial [Bacteroidales bacterium]|nr:hypothetical protein [Bacteroidales bacterium]
KVNGYGRFGWVDILRFLHDRQLTQDYTPEEKALIYQKATLDQNGNWTINGKDINSLTAADFTELKPHEEKIEDYLSQLVTIGDRILGNDKAQQLTLSKETLDEYFQAKENMLKTSTDNFMANYEKNKSKIIESYNFIAKSYEGYCQTAVQGNSEIEKMNTEILSNAKNIAATFSEANQILQGALESMRSNNVDNVDVSNRNVEGIEPNEAKARKTQELEDWYNNSDWRDDSFAELAYKLSTETDRSKRWDIMKDLRGDGWFDLKEDGMEDWFSEQDVIDRWNLLVSKGNYSADGKKLKDGFSFADGSPMSVAATKVTPINDGQVAATAPNDYGIFAKVGGPFDKLFNGVFERINQVYNAVMPREYDPFKGLRVEEPIQSIKTLKEAADLASRQNNQMPIKIEPITLNINLEGALGQSKDFMEQLSNNPLMMRSMVQLISEAINQNINGGKSSYTGGVTSPRFAGMNF